VSKKKSGAAVASTGDEPEKRLNRYVGILLKIFRDHHQTGITTFEFERREIETAAKQLKVDLPKNLGDLIYSFRYRTEMPKEIAETAPAGQEWAILPAGRARYRMQLRKIIRILPSPNLYQIKIPDATPEIIAKYALGDEQALLAKVRYNRLIDIFLRITAYSLQNHLRTTVPDVGQIETDELYVGVRNTGQQFIVPVQAKGGTDQIGIVQVEQDLALCKHAFPDLTPRLVAVQFKKDEEGEVIVLFELVQKDEEIRVLDEKHYRLVPADTITKQDLETMARTSN
jgi:hypothetical protein